MTGERIWATHEANEGGSTPAVADGMVYAGRKLSETSEVACFDAMTGAMQWSVSLPPDLWTMSCMTIWNNMLFVPTFQFQDEGFLFALDASNGDIIWQNSDSYGGYWDSSPVVVDSVIYIACADGSCRAIEAMSGQTVWETPITPDDQIDATIAYHDQRLYFGDRTVSYHCLSAIDGETIWEVPGEQHNASGIADGIVFYGEYSHPDGARVFALDCETGQEVWSYRTNGEYIRSGPAITDGIVYIAGQDWNLYAFGTELKYTYLDDLFAAVGPNELIVTSYDDGVAVAADTISFTVTQTGLMVDPMNRLSLQVSPNPF